MRIAILGAGSIGCFVGGAWQGARLPITFIGRARIAEDLATHGMTLTDSEGWERHLPIKDIAFSDSPEAMRESELIVLSVKSGGTREAAIQIGNYARAGVPVLSLQNGVGNIDVLEGALSHRHPVIRGMVPYNVAYMGAGRFHKGVKGQLYVEDCSAMRDLAKHVGQSPASLVLRDDMTEVAWGKLIFNLNNAINALSGRPLADQLSQRDYRRVMAATMREALRLLKIAGIHPARIGPIPARFLPEVFEAPDWLFNPLVLKFQKIDSKARSSMADDLAQGRRTEIDHLNGEVVALAERLGRPAAVNRAVISLVRKAESGGRRDWSAGELRRAVLS
jgi:2-dehydropantoate 2-reductase